MRLIDADALEDYIGSEESGLCEAREFQHDYIECIYEMPTIDPVKHGHWIDIDVGYECSQCHVNRIPYWLRRDNFCSYCGADMRGSNEND